MAQGPMIATVTAKTIKLVITMIILFLYRRGDNGNFLGAGAVWNLKEDKNEDVEILSSGVFIGFFVYNLSVLITYCLTSEKSLNDCIMNICGVLLWVAVAGVSLHYWLGYQTPHHQEVIELERDAGLALGSLCVLNAATHLIDTVFTFKLYENKHL
ncbi:UNVERIFIED_CONTAM: hypothetical protein PYX00_000416 [Menopon gallinae]|uniref:Uncharacterized protein n=1 Tax=Menopon gallinae TaxID=328185 RepID=A0AAW2IAB0_9NEOP